MAAGKYYAVKKGKTTGIYRTWEECRTSVEGVSGAVYKSFKTLSEAEAFMGNAVSKRFSVLGRGGICLAVYV